MATGGHLGLNANRRLRGRVGARALAHTRHFDALCWPDGGTYMVLSPAPLTTVACTTTAVAIGGWLVICTAPCGGGALDPGTVGTGAWAPPGPAGGLFWLQPLTAKKMHAQMQHRPQQPRIGPTMIQTRTPAEIP